MVLSVPNSTAHSAVGTGILSRLADKHLVGNVLRLARTGEIPQHDLIGLRIAVVAAIVQAAASSLSDFVRSLLAEKRPAIFVAKALAKR